MRSSRPKHPSKPASSSGRPSPSAPQDRVDALLERLTSGGPLPANAAEELDRLQAKLAREGRLEEIRARVEVLCEEWADGALHGERAAAWLTLVGGFRLKEQGEGVAAVLRDHAASVRTRTQAARVLASLGGEAAVSALQAVLLEPGDPHVRAAAAEALGELGDASVRAVLEALLEEDLPRPVWIAVEGAVSRPR